MSGGPYVIKRLGTEGSVFRITGHELKRYEERVADENLEPELNLHN